MNRTDPKTQEFLDRYPRLFKQLKWLETGEGWNTLLHSLCSAIEWHIEHLPEELREHVYASQIKEKFGTLRFYMNQETPFIEGAIAVAESLSARICERCGLPGAVRNGGWVRTLCDTCHKEQKELEEAAQAKYRASREDKI